LQPSRPRFAPMTNHKQLDVHRFKCKFGLTCLLSEPNVPGLHTLEPIEPVPTIKKSARD
jgi:hypothetical protein